MFKYQMHIHTYPVSDCARVSPEDYAKILSAGGYSGCVLTNHFLHGNTGIDRSLPWKSFVEEYSKDYYIMKQAGDKLGIDVLYGVEENVGRGLEILCYGLTPQMLSDHPELENNDSKLWHDVLSPLGVLCIQAHPFRDRIYIPEPGALSLDEIDGIEVYNYCNTPADNDAAAAFAKKHPHLICVSGGDGHEDFQGCKSGILTRQRITNEAMLADVLRKREYDLIIE